MAARRKPAAATDARDDGPILGGPKRPFDIDEMFRRVNEAVKDVPKAALFELAANGFDTPFGILVGCIISIRTRDETSLPVAKRLFERARTPEAMSKLSPAEIDSLIRDCTFHEPKSRQIHEIARRIVSEHGGELPCDYGVLTSFRGVGPKCANLTLGIACPMAAAGIGVDVHVHRVTNRWGYVSAATPEKTMLALHERLPRRYWVPINAALVPFGKHVCTGTRPRCSACPVREFCRQVGVTDPR